MSCWRSATARAIRSRCSRARRRDRGQAILHRRAHRASAIADRSLPLRHGAGHPRLGAADYKLVHHGTNGRSVYSFCMCPGGTVVAATSEPGRVVTNGMSQYSRDERNANAGIVVGITPADYPGPSARRHRVPAPLGGARIRGRRQAPMRHRRSASAIFSRAGLDDAWRGRAFL